VLQRAGDTCLAQKAPLDVGVVAQVGLDDLDGQVAAQPRVTGPVHLAHAAAAQTLGQLVAAQVQTGRRRGVAPGQAAQPQPQRLVEVAPLLVRVVEDVAAVLPLGLPPLVIVSGERPVPWPPIIAGGEAVSGCRRFAAGRRSVAAPPTFEVWRSLVG
jgi:hypothetical protein